MYNIIVLIYGWDLNLPYHFHRFCWPRVQYVDKSIFYKSCSKKSYSWGVYYPLGKPAVIDYLFYVHLSSYQSVKSQSMGRNKFCLTSTNFIPLIDRYLVILVMTIQCLQTQNDLNPKRFCHNINLGNKVFA